MQSKSENKTPQEPYLVTSENGIALTDGIMTFRGDFSSLLPRISKGRLSHEVLIKAAKTNIENPTAIDAAAGMGEDGFLLAAYGYKTILCEKNPVIFALLEDALERALLDSRIKDIAERISLYQGDCKDLFSSLTKSPDLIYLDPMFPKKQKSSLTGKKLQLIQKLESPCQDEGAIFWDSVNCSPGKIIVKRPIKGTYLAKVKPAYSLTGKTVRFDCYTGRITESKNHPSKS